MTDVSIKERIANLELDIYDDDHSSRARSHKPLEYRYYRRLSDGALFPLHRLVGWLRIEYKNDVLCTWGAPGDWIIAWGITTPRPSYGLGRNEWFQGNFDPEPVGEDTWIG